MRRVAGHGVAAASGWSVSELAARAGLFPAELRRIEERKRMLGDQAPKLARALGVSAGHLLAVRRGFRSCEDVLADIDDELDWELPVTSPFAQPRRHSSA